MSVSSVSSVNPTPGPVPQERFIFPTAETISDSLRKDVSIYSESQLLPYCAQIATFIAHRVLSQYEIYNMLCNYFNNIEIRYLQQVRRELGYASLAGCLPPGECASLFEAALITCASDYSCSQYHVPDGFDFEFPSVGELLIYFRGHHLIKDAPEYREITHQIAGAFENRRYTSHPKLKRELIKLLYNSGIHSKPYYQNAFRAYYTAISDYYHLSLSKKQGEKLRAHIQMQKEIRTPLGQIDAFLGPNIQTDFTMKLTAPHPL